MATKQKDIVTKLANATIISTNATFDATKSPQLHDELKSQWDIANKKSSISDAWFHRIYHQHNETGRYYHTAVHLKEMLEYLQLLESSKDDTTLLPTSSSQWYRLAIFFHDVVYNPQSSQNERDSILLFAQFCKELNLPETTKNVVSTLILATEKHQIIHTDGDDNVEDPLQQVFLDMDMAVLGKKTGAYLAYAALIRKEYSFVPRQVYCEKRAAILDSFLKQRPQIYLSDIFHQALEKQARQNLKKEIELLLEGLIPGEEKDDGSTC